MASVPPYQSIIVTLTMIFFAGNADNGSSLATGDAGFVGMRVHKLTYAGDTFASA